MSITIVERSGYNRPHQGNALGIYLESTMRFTDSDHSAGQLLQLLLLEMGLSAYLAELDRRVAADPAFLQEIKRRALAYLAARSV